MAGFGDLNRVNTNVQALDAQLSLNKINKDLSNNQLRLSTGLRINRAEDDAAGYSIGTKLRSRVAGLEQALQNVGDAKSVLDIAEASFSTVMDSLIEMKSLATQAANETLGAEERRFIADQISELAKDINKVADQTVFQDTQLLNGDDGSHSGALTMTFQVGERAVDTLDTNIEAVNINQLFENSAAAYDVKTTTIGLTDLTGGGTIDFQTGTAGALVNVESVDYDGFDENDPEASLQALQSISDAINSANIAGISAKVNEAGDGIEISNASTEAYTLGGDITNTVDEATAFAPGQGAMNLSDWDAEDFRAFLANVDASITSMADRVNEVGMVQSSLSTRELTLSQAISANQAATSRIMDADFAKEQSESIRLQIMQQTATAALSQANMGPQSVLSFLG